MEEQAQRTREVRETEIEKCFFQKKNFPQNYQFVNVFMYLCRRTKHNVPSETIRRMLNGYERYVTVQSIMGSQMPLEKQRLLLENRSLQ